MKYATIPILALAATLGPGQLACGGAASQVEVKGSDSDVVGLAGAWKGEYVGVDSGRKGEIVFNLTAGHYTAEGEVLMHPDNAPNKTRPLKIRFVEVDGGGTLRGTMEPYTDPQCQCSMIAEFVGQRQGDRIEGKFTASEVGSERSQTGRWWAERQ
ncbi:MAG: hypothetical protein AAGC55_20885 [Myxococcota bacterium]